jgi:hypothetical protein
LVGLVEQLQAEALDPAMSVANLLRKVKVAAVKLQLSDTVEWADKELRGYDEAVPQYRIVRGICKGFDRYNGWTTVGGSPEIMEALSNRAIGQPISSLEEVCTGERDQLMVTYPHSVSHSIIKSNPGCEDVALFLTQADAIAIVDHVRNLVLDWALDLERAGILGEGLAFSLQERKQAAASHVEIKIEGANARLNIGSSDHSNNITAAE